MIEFYAQIRLAHVTTVIASGTLLLLRGLLVGAGRSDLALAPLPRYASYAIDTTLLTAALMLLTILPSTVYANGWLATKLALLPLYVALGWLALRRPGVRARQVAYLAGAAIVFLCMFAIARTHDPAGPLLLLMGVATD